MCVQGALHHVKPTWTWIVSSPPHKLLILICFFPSCLSSSWNCITPAENSNWGGREGSKQPGLLHLKRLFNLLDCTSSSLRVCRLVCSLWALTRKRNKQKNLMSAPSWTFHSICHPTGLSTSCFHLLLHNQTINCCCLLNQVVCSYVVI